MLINLRTRLAHSLRSLLPSPFESAIGAAPFVDIDHLIPVERRIVVVAPHPDDEVIGCGGMLAAAAERGNSVALIAVTDGEACYPPTPGCTRQQLAAMRRAESMEALQRLGVVPVSVTRLGLPDGAVPEHMHVLVQHLRRLLRPDDIVISTWRHDGHVDHDAVGAATAAAADSRGARLIEVPIWAWHRSAGAESHLRGSKIQRIALTTRWEMRKEYALAAYASQVRPAAPLPRVPALPGELIASWLRNWETAIVE
jgi:LmbE family N-acetylglucosaminyl deacetylase